MSYRVKTPLSAMTSSIGSTDATEDSGNMMARLAAISDDASRIAALRECYDRIDSAAIQLLTAKAAQGEASWEALLRDLQARSR